MNTEEKIWLENIRPKYLYKALPIIERIRWTKGLYSEDPNCNHYVYEKWSGVACARCPGWFCA